MDDVTQQTRAAAFRLLLETGQAVSANQIAAELNAAPSAVRAELGQLDVVGIVGTLRADARSVSRSPASGLDIRLQFDARRTAASPVVLFFPDDRGSVRTIDDWCSNANFFENREAALS